jgi:hypothetical protein
MPTSRTARRAPTAGLCGSRAAASRQRASCLAAHC